MATKASSSSCFNFLKESLILPTRNPKIFAPVFLLITVLAYFVILTNVLSIQPCLTKILLIVGKFNKVDPGSEEYARLLEELQKEASELMLIAFALFLTGIIVIFTKLIITVFAISTTCRCERYSFTELLCKVIRKNLKGRPAVTVAFIYVLEFTGMMLVMELASFLVRHSGLLFRLSVLLYLVAFVFYLYFSAMCSVNGIMSMVEVAVMARACSVGRCGS